MNISSSFGDGVGSVDFESGSVVGKRRVRVDVKALVGSCCASVRLAIRVWHRRHIDEGLRIRRRSGVAILGCNILICGVVFEMTVLEDS